MKKGDFIRDGMEANLAKKAIFDKLESQVIRGQNDRNKYKRNTTPTRG